jgi:hypothetical protein
MIGKKTRVAGRDYTQVMLYIPKELVDDSTWPFALENPCEITVDPAREQMTVKSIAKDEALRKGWIRRGKGTSKK